MVLIGELLTTEQCWEEYHSDRNSDFRYDLWEMEVSQEHELAIEFKEKAFELMEKEVEEVEECENDSILLYKYSEDYFNTHHLPVERQPYWQTCVTRITELLKQK